MLSSLQESLHRHCSQLASNPACQSVMHSACLPAKSMRMCSDLDEIDGACLRHVCNCTCISRQQHIYACAAKQSAQALASTIVVLLVSRS